MGGWRFELQGVVVGERGVVRGKVRRARRRRG